MASAQAAPVLELTGVHLQFPGVKALTDAGLRLYPGEVHTLMGQNGAGKSSLIKVLTGLYAPDQGVMTLDGTAVSPNSVQDAQALGINAVYQEVNLCPNLSVAENIYVGRYPRRFGMIDWRAMRRGASALLEKLDVYIDVSKALESYPLAIQQMVAIARALDGSSRVLVLDEPTSSLDEAEVKRLFEVLRTLQKRGMAILLVTHFLEQAFAISDRVTVMRNGQREGEYKASALTPLELVNRMVGEPPKTAAMEPTLSEEVQHAPPFLHARGLALKGVLAPTDVELRSGEILGLCGLLGSGRTETARLLFGADKVDSGFIEIGARRLRFVSPRDAIKEGIAFCSEDRKLEGAVLPLSVRENLILAMQVRAGIWRSIPLNTQQAVAEDFIHQLGIKTADIEAPIATLSGGNQQKVLLARWLVTQPKALILDEPTRGIDIRAKQEIMNLIDGLCRKGMAILFISSELSEVLRCSHRMLVLRDRRVCGEFRRGELDETSVLHIIAGATA